MMQNVFFRLGWQDPWSVSSMMSITAHCLRVPRNGGISAYVSPVLLGLMLGSAKWWILLAKTSKLTQG